MCPYWEMGEGIVNSRSCGTASLSTSEKEISCIIYSGRRGAKLYEVIIWKTHTQMMMMIMMMTIIIIIENSMMLSIVFLSCLTYHLFTDDWFSGLHNPDIYSHYETPVFCQLPTYISLVGHLNPLCLKHVCYSLIPRMYYLLLLWFDN